MQRIEKNRDLSRDPRSNAIISTDYAGYRARKSAIALENALLQSRTDVENLKRRLLTLENKFRNLIKEV